MSLNNNQNEKINDDNDKDIDIKEENKIGDENIENNNQDNNNNDDTNKLNIQNNINNINNVNENMDSKEQNIINEENNKEDDYQESKIIQENNNESQHQINDNKNNNEINITTSSENDLNKIKKQNTPENTYMTSIDIIKKNYCMYDLDNSFAIFKLRNDHLYITYPLLHDFLCYDLNDEVVIATIKNAHDFFVLNFRYIYDTFSKRDILQTISGEDNNLKLWDIETWECIIDINANKFGIMFSACFLYDDYGKQNFLVTSNCTGNNYIQIFDFKGKKIKNVPFYEDIEKNSDNEEDSFHNNDNDNNNSNDNINFGNNSEDNDIHNENNNEFDNSENNNEEKSYNENNNINDDNFNNFNKDEEIQDNKSMNSNDINIEKNNLINNNENNEKELEEMKNDEKEIINENKEIEKDENINIISKKNDFIFKCYENNYDEEENIINDIKYNSELKEEDKDVIPKIRIFNNNEKINLVEKDDSDKNKDNSNIKINENINFDINNCIIKENNDIDTEQNIQLNKPNSEEKEKEEEEENNKNNILDNEIINDNNENFIINEEKTENMKIENEINTNTKENNNDINNNMDLDQNNNNSNISNNDNQNENENNNEIIINDVPQNKKPEIDHIYYIESYFDKKTCITYIISCCSECVKSFNYNTNILYHIYQENEKEKFIHGNVIIDDSSQNNNNLVKLIETCNDGYVRIWDFHMGDLLNKIKICEEGIKSICLWDENNIFVGCDDTTIKLVNINSNEITHTLYGHKQRVCCLKKIEHEKYGKCLISKGWGGDFIKLWKKKE